MATKFPSKNTTIFRFIENPTRFHLNAFVSSESPILNNNIIIQQQWRSYVKQHVRRHFSKVRDTFVSHSVNNSRSFSSSSSSSKIGLLRWYLRMLESRPVVTKSATSSIIYTVADLTSQAITLPPSGSFDLIRTSRMAAYGLLILGPSQHLWFNFMSKIVPKRDIFSTFKKIFMGQAIYGPCITTVFFSYDAALQGESGDDIIAKLKRDLIPTLTSSLVYWPMCDFLTYKFVPVHLQPLVNSSFAYVWTIYLTYMASLKVSSD